MDAASLGNPQTLNLYAYCGNDPINHVDPSGLFFGWIGKAFKWIARVAAVVVAVAAVLAVTWGFGAALAIKLGLAAFKFALDGWGNSKWTRLLGAGIGAYFGFSVSSNARTPNTFPSGTGVGGVSYFNDPPVIRESMEHLGILDTGENRDMIRDHLIDAARQPDNISGSFCNQYGEFITKESMLPGPTGRFAKVESTWMVMPNHRLRLTTVIIKR